MAVTNLDLQNTYDMPARLPPTSRRYNAWTPEWYAEIGVSKTTKFHINQLLDLTFGAPLNVRLLNIWIDTGTMISQNYTHPRLTLATKIIFITKGFRYTAFTRMWLRRTRYIDNEVALRNLRN